MHGVKHTKDETVGMYILQTESFGYNVDPGVLNF